MKSAFRIRVWLPAILIAAALPSFIVADETSSVRRVEVGDSDETADVTGDAVLRTSARLTRDFQESLDALEDVDEAKPGAIDQYSKRGDLRMFLGRFDEAVSDYRAMVRLRPALDASHWRLGIALYFNGKPEDAAAQFDRYHAFDNVDRENGIWRYLSHARAFGTEKAAAQLLRYEKDDRPPFAEVYRLFDGTMTADDVRASISKELPPRDLAARRFYGELYIGLHHATLGQPELARPALREAVLNDWALTAGYGPSWMWQVGRLQYLQLPPEHTEESLPEETQAPDSQ